MKDIFQKRRYQFRAQCLKYLRYVLNDHFVLALMVLSGFVLWQYRQLLTDLPEERWWLVLALVLILGSVLSFGRVASFVLPADKVFLLPQEQSVWSELVLAGRRSFILWGLLQTVLVLFLTPLFLALGLSWLAILGLVFLLLLIRYAILGLRISGDYKQGCLDWDGLIRQEQERRQAILRFFALFTNVKGISTRTKRRAYFDGLLQRMPKTQKTLWLNLYLRAFLRSGDYLALTVRLLGLALLALLFVEQDLLAVGLTLLLNYLLLFQFLALYQHYDYQYMTQLYPADKQLKSDNFLLFLRCLGLLLLGVEAIFVGSWQALGLLLLGMAGILYLYLPHKLKQMID